MNFPFRVGATSYVIPGDLVENAEYLAAGRAAGGYYPGLDARLPIVEDMQLVLFDVAGGPSNVPDGATAARLAEIGRASGLGYSVHLMRDLDGAKMSGAEEDVAGEAGISAAWESARDVMARTKLLEPFAYVAHLEGRQLRAGNYADMATWEAAMGETLGVVGTWCGGPARLAVENLEGYPPGLVAEPAGRAGACRCVDVGHLWLDGHDPLPWLDAAMGLRMIHLHGVGYDAARQRLADHMALDCMQSEPLDALCDWLRRRAFGGVVTLEVFGQEDFVRSLQALAAAWRRTEEDFQREPGKR